MTQMTTDEKKAFEQMEDNVDKIKQDVSHILTALLGSDISGGGLVNQMAALKVELDLTKSEVKLLTEERVKNTVYVKIITWLLSIIGVGIVGLIISYFKR